MPGLPAAASAGKRQKSDLFAVLCFLSRRRFAAPVAVSAKKLQKSDLPSGASARKRRKPGRHGSGMALKYGQAAAPAGPPPPARGSFLTAENLLTGRFKAGSNQTELSSLGLTS